MIDKLIFDQQLEVYGLVLQKNQTSTFLNQLQKQVLRIKSKKTVIPYDSTHNILLLDQKVQISDLNEQIRQQIEQSKIEIIRQKININYDDLNMQQVLQKLLPQDFLKKNMIPSSFETAGHIAHLNLFPCHDEYKYMIAQVLLDKNKEIKTVVNKIESLKDNIFRNPKLELIGGLDNYVTLINEGNCKFQIDFSKVYWNSRLNQERDRMLKKFKKGETLCDMFCGVGPLAIRAAKMGVKVLANDLNPDCYKYLLQNINKNKVQSMIQPFNMCAREFFKQIIQKHKFEHVYMNLPGTAYQFLDVFQEYLENNELQNQIIIHLYTFLSIENEQNYEETLIQKIKNTLQYFEKKDIIEIYNVRDVSASSKMYSVSFYLRKNIETNQIKKIKFE